MPGWHETTREARRSGRLQVLGLIQEQHPERCRLFMQWKRLEWPVLVDSLGLLGVSAVPIAILVDERGVVRKIRARAGDLETFLGGDGQPPADGQPARPAPDPDRLQREANERPDRTDRWMALGDALFLRAGAGDLSASAAAYRRALERDAPPDAWFRLGVVLRRRHETTAGEPGDFQAAVDAWARALSLRPNQYIWRRRIQQYGPRLDKPYSFYDWVKAARRDIRDRGERPVELVVEPAGAEIAFPSETFSPDTAPAGAPDPDGKIARDARPLVRVESTVTFDTGSPPATARIHLDFRPDLAHGAHWNNEAGPLLVWIEAPPGVEIDRQLHEAAGPRTVVSQETRRVEFEARVGEAARDRAQEPIRVPGYALYHVCEDLDGVCHYLRRDIEVTLRWPPRQRR